MQIETKQLFNLTHSLAGEYLSQFEYPWQALDGIKELILALGPALSQDEYEECMSEVWVHKSAIIAPTAYLGAPCIIGAETEVRHCAFIRGSAPGLCPGGRALRGGQFGGAEECDPLRQCADPTLQLRGGFHLGL